MNAIHPLWFVPANNSDAKIGLTPCPGTKDSSLPEALGYLKEQGISAVLTLMTQEELEKNQVEAMEAEANKLGMKWFHLPIADDEGPAEAFLTAWKSSGPQVHELLNNRQSIAIHCKGGSGRTGLVAAQIMLERGMDLEKIIPMIKEHRPGAFTSPLQQDYIRQVADSLH